jgi:hypothetical protein
MRIFVWAAHGEEFLARAMDLLVWILGSRRRLQLTKGAPCGVIGKRNWRDASRKNARSEATTGLLTNGRWLSQSSNHMTGCLRQAQRFTLGKWLRWAMGLLVWILGSRRRLQRAKGAPCGMIGKRNWRNALATKRARRARRASETATFHFIE